MSGIEETDPPQKAKQSSKGAIIGGLVIFLILWIVWASMRKPNAATVLLDLNEDHQIPLVLDDQQGSGGGAANDQVAAEMKAMSEARKKPPVAMGKTDVWYTFYPPTDEDEKIKAEVKAGNGWTVKSEGEQVYTWKGRYDIKLRALATSANFPIGVEFKENNLGFGDKIMLTLKNMIP